MKGLIIAILVGASILGILSLLSLGEKNEQDYTEVKGKNAMVIVGIIAVIILITMII